MVNRGVNSVHSMPNCLNPTYIAEDTGLKGSTMSLYADYIKEHRNDECIESDKGFCVYRFLNEKQVYIVDIYVDHPYRKSQEASNMADIVVQKAKEKGCTELLGSVVPSARNSTNSIKVLLGYGMKLDSSSNDIVVFKKGI